MRQTLTATLGCAALTLLAGALWTGPAVAQDQSSELGMRMRPADVAAQRRVRPRIVVTPSQRLVRQCVDGYAVEHRAAGDTVVPYMYCEWAYR